MPDATATNSAIDLIIYSLTVAAGLSLVIERILELFKHFTDFESKRGDESLRTSQIKQSCKEAFEAAQKVRKALLVYKTGKNIDAFAASLETPQQSTVLSAPVAEMDIETDEGFENNEAIKVIPLTPASATKIKQRAFLQLAAAGLGIAVAEAFNLQLLTLFFAVMEQSRLVDIVTTYPLIDTVVTGIVIGGGSQPVHVLLRFLTTRKVQTTEPAEPQPPAPEVAVEAPAANTEKLIPITYNGGIDRDKLQTRNFRPGNPSKVVYHHTAMHHKNSFQAVVDEITKIKKWSTGYHCVVMPDGKIEFFCRWDRVGNHAYGANPESLGIAFHGNFHTKGNDQFSNQNGQFGNQEPTDEQIDAGAKVIALWAHLYELDLDFERSIVPHYLVKPTACPGSNFPHQKLQKQIKKYYQQWGTSKAEKEIAAFKQLPYVYV